MQAFKLVGAASKIVIAMVMLLIAPFQITATTHIPIYEQIVSVADKKIQTRKKSMQMALQQVLVRVSGNSQVNDNVAAQNASKNPEQFLQAYEYQAAAGEGNSTDNQWQVRFLFEARKVNQFLLAQGESIWSAQRPQVLVWWVVGNDPLVTSSEMVGHDNAQQYAEIWQRFANQRGFESTFPINDLSTMTSIELQDIWHANPEKIIAASKRYATDISVAVTLYPAENGNWQGSLTVVSTADETQQWQFNREDREQTIKAMVDKLTDTVAQRDTLQSQSYASHQLTVLLSNIHNGQSLQSSMRYLTNLSHVAAVRLLKMGGDNVLLEMDFQGDDAYLVQQIKNDKRLLILESGTDPQMSANLQLKYIS